MGYPTKIQLISPCQNTHIILFISNLLLITLLNLSWYFLV